MKSDLRNVGLIIALTVALHLPFLRQGIHLDDVAFLDIASNIAKSPLFPLDMPYVFTGKHVSMWGHTHPPLNSYLIAAVMFLSGGTASEVVLHSVYLLFPLLATVSFYFLAKRFVQTPFLAAAVFACLPALVVIANSVQADSPLLALWLCAVALFIRGNDRNESRVEALAVLPITAAVFMAYQGVAVIPLLAFYAFQRGRLTKRTALLLCLPFFGLLSWQLLGFLYKGSSYATVLSGYLLERRQIWLLKTKIRNVASTLGYLGGTFVLFPFLLITFGRRWKGLLALIGLAGGMAAVAAVYRLAFHYGWAQKAFFIVCFAGGFVACLWALAGGLRSLRKESNPDDVFLCLWFLGVVFYCIAVFDHGSARYLLPGAAPLILLLVRANEAALAGLGRWRLFYATLLPCQLVLGLSLAHADYEVAQTYRQAGLDFGKQYLPIRRPFLFSAECDLRYYLTVLGGQIMADDTVADPGELVVKSRNLLSIAFDNQLDRSLEVVGRKTYWVSSPLRLLDDNAKAGFWSDGWGVLPFWFSRQPLDVITVYRVGQSYKPPSGPAGTEKTRSQTSSLPAGPFHPVKD